MTEDALEVVQVAPLTAAVGIHPDKVAAVRSVQGTHGSAVCHGSLVDTWGPKLDVLMGLCGWLSGPRCHLHYQRHTEEARCPAQIQPSACHRGPQGAGPAPSVCFSYKELATPVPVDRKGASSLWF